MFDDYNYYDHENIDDLYDDWDDNETVEQNEWENYYHNVANEIVDE